MDIIVIIVVECRWVVSSFKLVATTLPSILLGGGKLGMVWEYLFDKVGATEGTNVAVVEFVVTRMAEL